ncbi:MAG: hypothetical protein B6I19_10850 [Bacteroidetes bacterium 4572_114]|nr:MAG: hypothetical protein B6I19_10850 [Bacteroidetes bacterium 4572_114]
MKNLNIAISALTLLFYLNTDSFCQSNFILAGETSGSSTVYTDLIPDIRIINFYNSNSIWYYDIDKDDIYDFLFKSSSVQSPGGVYKKEYKIETTGGESIAMHPSSPQCADVINANDTIGDNLIWGTSAILWYYSSYPGGTPIDIGFWQNVEGKYLGLKKVIGNDTIYCWFQLYVANDYIHFREFATSQQLAKTKDFNVKTIDGIKLVPSTDPEFSK